MAKPLDSLRVVRLQGADEAVGEPAPVFNETPPLLNQVHQRAHLDALRLQRFETLAMTQHQVEGELRIGGVVFGARRFERFTVLRQHRRVDREEHEEVVLL